MEGEGGGARSGLHSLQGFDRDERPENSKSTLKKTAKQADRGRGTALELEEGLARDTQANLLLNLPAITVANCPGFKHYSTSRRVRKMQKSAKNTGKQYIESVTEKFNVTGIDVSNSGFLSRNQMGAAAAAQSVKDTGAEYAASVQAELQATGRDTSNSGSRSRPPRNLSE